MDIMPLIMAIIGAVIYNLIGYFRLRDPGEKPSPVKIIRTIIIGVIIGIVAMWKGISFSDADLLIHLIAASTPIGLSFMVDQIALAIWKWVKGYASRSPKQPEQAPQEPPKPEQ